MSRQPTLPFHAALALVPGMAVAGTATGPPATGAAWLPVAGLCLGLLAAAVAGAWWWRRRHRDTPPPLQAPQEVQTLQAMQALLDALPCAAFVKDGEGRYRAVNAAFLGLYGCVPADVLGHTLAETRQVHGSDSGPLAQAEAALDADSPMVVRELQRPPQDGREPARTFSLRLCRLPGPAGATGVAGTLLDVSARDQARHASEAAARTTGSFLSIMGQEMRAPLAATLGQLERLSRTPLDPEQARLVGQLEESADTLLGILGDVLDFSRIEAGELAPQPVPCDLRMLVDGLLALFAPQARERGLRLYSVLDWRLAAEYHCDAARIRQVLANLLSNAIRSTAAGHVELRICVAGADAGGHRLRLVVADTGPGVEAAPAATPPGAAGDRGDTRPGLGLCRQLAQLMGGTIALSRRADGGTLATFEAVVPVLQAQAAQPGMAGRIALLCSRDPHVAEGLANALSALGFNLVEALPDDLDTVEASDAHLFLADAGLVDAGRLPAQVRCVRIIGPPGLDSRVTADGDVELHAVPLLWRAMVRACQAALGSTPRSGARALPATLQAASAGARILVAEDHPINRAVISRQLQRLGHAHELVEDGEQALEALGRARFDLLITDCRMPGLDGYALTRRIRATERDGDPRLPIIALSASVPPGQAQSCIDAGMDGFLAKPVQLRALELQIAAHLGTLAAPGRAATARTAPAARSDYRQLALLMEAFGSLRQVRDVLGQLLETGRQDMAALDAALRDGAPDEQRELLHRLCGSLSLLYEGCPQEAARPGTDNRQRRDLMAQRLDAVQELLDGLDARPLAMDGG